MSLLLELFEGSRRGQARTEHPTPMVFFEKPSSLPLKPSAKQNKGGNEHHEPELSASH